MDIYEFSQALWRQKWLVALGFALLLVFVVALSLDFSNGVALRSTAKYEVDVEMAVIPDGYESLAQDLGSRSLGSAATLFASLLSSPQAAQDIAEQQGVQILELDGAATGRDRFFTAKALSDSPEGAVSAGLGAFEWLEQRLSEPLVIASAPTKTVPQSTPLDADGQFHGTVRLDLDHALANDSEGLWIIARTPGTDGFAFRLADAAEEISTDYAVVLAPGQDLLISLEDATGQTLDVVSVPVPPFPVDGNSFYHLVVGIDRGFVRGAAEGARLEGSYVSTAWLSADPSSISTETADVSDVSILLLTDTPVPESIGGRKTPLLIIAVISAGTIALLVLAVAVDTWKQEDRHRNEPSGDTVRSALMPIASANQDVEQGVQSTKS